LLPGTEVFTYAFFVADSGVMVLLAPLAGSGAGFSSVLGVVEDDVVLVVPAAGAGLLSVFGAAVVEVVSGFESVVGFAAGAAAVCCPLPTQSVVYPFVTVTIAEPELAPLESLIRIVTEVPTGWSS
jgi:hypothetical protein